MKTRLLIIMLSLFGLVSIFLISTSGILISPDGNDCYVINEDGTKDKCRAITGWWNELSYQLSDNSQNCDEICKIGNLQKSESDSKDDLTFRIPLSDFEDIGCENQTLDHLYRYSNLFDKEFDGNYVIATIGLPEGMTPEKLQECVNVILEKRLLIFKVVKDDFTFDVPYAIKGGMVKDMVFSNKTNSLFLTIDVDHQGSLEIAIPRDLLDAKLDYCPPIHENPYDDRFFVLLDGEEILYDEISTTYKNRTLQIIFDVESEKIEIIAACLI